MNKMIYVITVICCICTIIYIGLVSYIFVLKANNNTNTNAEFIIPDDRIIDQQKFPWKDILSCKDKRINVPKEYQNINCPHCNKKVRWIRFTSPKWTWEELCGREGPMAICLDCEEQIIFICEMMN